MPCPRAVASKALPAATQMEDKKFNQRNRILAHKAI